MITPGITTEQDALQKIRVAAGTENCASWDARSQGGDRGVRCGFSMGLAFDTQGYVETVGFRPTKMTLGAVVAEYGVPDGQRVTLNSVSVTPPQLGMLVFYDALRASLSLPEQSGDAYEAAAATPIVDLLYANAAVYSSTTRYRHGWSGFGSYSLQVP